LTSNHSNKSFATLLEKSKHVIPVITLYDLDDALPMAQALHEGGINILEITLRTPLGLQAIELIKQEMPSVIVGAGTVTTPDLLTKAVESGADFIISPGFTPSLLQAAKEWGGIFLPGVATASELMQVSEVGFKEVKFFPAEAAGGIDMLESWAGPLPDILVCPTGGISPSNYQRYLSVSNVMCVGGSWLVTPEDLKDKQWDSIKQKATAVRSY